MLLKGVPGWPAGMRVIVRRERPHPGAQLDLFETRDGWRYTAFVTNTTTGQLRWLEVRHRAPRPGRGPGALRQGHRSGSASASSRSTRPGGVAAAIATDLTAWLQLLDLTGELHAHGRPTPIDRGPSALVDQFDRN
jgi:hypothetical protein